MPRPRTPARKGPAPRASTSRILHITLVLSAVTGAITWWISRPAPPATSVTPTAPPPSSASALATAAAADFPLATAAPDAPSPIDPRAPLDAYVGRGRCAECHRDEHARWLKDWHARALNPAAPEVVVGDHRKAYFKGTSSEAWMDRAKGKYTMRTAGKGGEIGTFTVDWVVGGKRMQDSLTVFPDGRWQILPVYYHVTGKGEWVDYTEAKQGALHPDHPYYWTNFRRTANHECLDCHSAGLQVSYDRAARRWDTRIVDPGVACESCHGPGARHAETQEPADIVHPGKVAPEIGLAVCGQCHGPRQPLFSLLDAARRYVPGQRYEAHYLPHGMVSGKGRSGDFYADGRPKTSSFEYQALIQSRCHLAGKATCLTCHTAPHAKEQDFDEMKPPKDASLAGPAREDEAACRGCHAPLFADPQAHTHHSSPAAQSCIACHMPRVVTGVLDTFADHAIDVPVPENTERHDVPNACNQCHSEKAPADMARAIDGWWPEAKARRGRRLRLADALDEKTAERSEGALRAVIADAGEAAFLRGIAVQLLAQRFPKAALDAIVSLFSASDPLLRTRAAEAIATARLKGAADALARLGQDPSAFVREAAAIALSELGDPRAEGALRTLSSSPETEALPRPHALLALALVRRGDVDGAIAEAERAVDLQPYYVDALILLADLYAKRNMFERTRALIEETLSFDPQHPGARQRLRVLTMGR